MRLLHTAQNYSDSMADDTSALHQKIRAILERANHLNTPQAEAETALALAFRLMQKHNISESDFISDNAGVRHHSITSQQFVLAGPYRVRRGALLHVISLAVNCASYRDMMDTAPNTVTMVAFGSPHDLYSLEILFTTAELLALRTMPQGDRRFRTSWWQGFTVGVDKKLKQENSSLIREAPGAGLVLVEQSKRADAEMRLATPHLRSSSTTYSSDRDAFSAGRSAGSQFSSSKKSTPLIAPCTRKREILLMSDPTEVALTYEMEQKFAEAMPTRTLLMSEASTWLRDICEQEDLDVPHLDSHALPQRIEAVAIAETWCILVNGVAPTQHTILHELAHLSCANKGHGKEFRTQLVSYIRRYISLEHAALLHSLFVNAQLSVEPFSATR